MNLIDTRTDVGNDRAHILEGIEAIRIPIRLHLTPTVQKRRFFRIGQALMEFEEIGKQYSENKFPHGKVITVFRQEKPAAGQPFLRIKADAGISPAIDTRLQAQLRHRPPALDEFRIGNLQWVVRQPMVQ